MQVLAIHDSDRREGAYGSRLTGAGWGGCSVSLVAQPNVEKFLAAIKEKYYFKHFPEWRQDKEKLVALESCIFSSVPGMGAVIIKIN